MDSKDGNPQNRVGPHPEYRRRQVGRFLSYFYYVVGVPCVGPRARPFIHIANLLSRRCKPDMGSLSRVDLIATDPLFVQLQDSLQGLWASKHRKGLQI